MPREGAGWVRKSFLGRKSLPDFPWDPVTIQPIALENVLHHPRAPVLRLPLSEGAQ